MRKECINYENLHNLSINSPASKPEDRAFGAALWAFIRTSIGL